MKKFLQIGLVPSLVSIAVMPVIASAQNTSCASTASIGALGSILCTISNILGAVLPILVALGVVYFVWGVVQYVIGDSDEAKKKGRDRMIFGIIGLVVIVGLWGLVYAVTSTFGTGGYSANNVGNFQGLLPQ